MIKSRRIVVALVGLLVLGLLSGWFQGAYAQKQNKKEAEEVYTRPKPKEPIRPEIPGANRYQTDKVFLEYADSLFRPAHSIEEFQIVKGSVKFRHGNMWMFCDSAYYYPEKNSMIAFGNVRMEQGDTLFVYADRLDYDGMERHATLVDGPSRDNVELKNRDVTLITDSLDYDLENEIGWYAIGGQLDDGVNTLNSIYGEYSPATKLAKFRNEVVLVNNKDGYRMITEELDYNTDTHIATINTKTRIEGATDTIETTRGWYDTQTDHAELTSRSLITHRDSTNKVTWLEGDSIIYDKASRLSKAFMFRDPMKVRQPMIITDTARKVQLIGGYGEYNDSTKLAFSTEYPLLIEYSRPDTLFLRADTILSFIRTEMVWPDSLAHGWSKATRMRLAKFKSILDIAADMHVELQLMDPRIPKPGYGLPVVKDSVVAELKDTIKIPESINKGDTLTIIEGDTIMHGELPTDKPRNDDREEGMEKTPSAVMPSVPKLRIDKLGRDSAYMVPKEFHVAKAIGRARFFNQDLQGVADTMIMEQYDSLLHLIRKPVVWSEERQVVGNRIDVHFNDSTPDWAILPDGGMLAEHLDEDFYNQVTGSVIKAWLENQKIRRAEVNGNVQVVFMPEEDDSTFSKLVNAESSYLNIDFKDGKVSHLKMWPEVTGTVTPAGEVKRTQKYLDGFRWLGMLRPQRQWYGSSLRWVDELGEVPEALDEWFKEPDVVKRTPISPAEYKDMMNK